MHKKTLYKHLSEKKRFFIEKSINKSNLTIQEIVHMLNRSKLTISREVKRNSKNNIYSTNFTQKNYSKFLTETLNGEG